MKMNKTLALIVAAVTVSALTISTYALFQKNDALKATLLTTTNQVDILEEKNATNQEVIEELRIEKKVLEDSIVVLNAKIVELTNDVSTYRKVIREMKAKVKRRNTKIQKLTKEIERLARAEKNNENIITEKQNRILALMNKVDELKKDIAPAELSLLEKQRKLAEARIREEQLALAKDITENTMVSFVKVDARENKDTGSFSKLRKNKKWRYTHIIAKLQHEIDNKRLLDKEFQVVLRNLDTGKIVAFNEGNPKHPGANNESGVIAKFNGNMIVVDYFNTEPKKGENYAIEINYLQNGKRYSLPSGTYQFIKDKKVLKR